MHGQFLVCIFATTIAALAIHSSQVRAHTEASPSEVSEEDARIKQNFTLIGKNGSKEYFVSKENEKVNWMEARDMCNKAGLDFAKIENADEFAYIYEKERGKDFWISAAMKGVAAYGENTLAGFEYTDGSPVPADINFEHASKFWLCLYMSGDHHTFPDYCITSKHHVLCQNSA